MWSVTDAHAPIPAVTLIPAGTPLRGGMGWRTFAGKVHSAVLNCLTLAHRVTDHE